MSIVKHYIYMHRFLIVMRLLMLKFIRTSTIYFILLEENDKKWLRKKKLCFHSSSDLNNRNIMIDVYARKIL